MSELPVNHGAPPPTAGPLSATTNILRWSIILRCVSRPRQNNVSEGCETEVTDAMELEIYKVGKERMLYLQQIE